MERYDAKDYNPPAPVVALTLSNHYEGITEETDGLLDSGADTSAITLEHADKLKLIKARDVETTGYDGVSTWKPTYYVNILFKEYNFFREVIGISIPKDEKQEVIIGRDILNQLEILLDGKNLSFEIEDP